MLKVELIEIISKWLTATDPFIKRIPSIFSYFHFDHFG